MGEAKRRGTFEERKSKAEPKVKKDKYRGISFLDLSALDLLNTRVSVHFLRGNKKGGGGKY